MSAAVTQTSQPLAHGWARLQATLDQTFAYDVDLQARARAMVQWLASNADVSRGVARGAPNR